MRYAGRLAVLLTAAGVLLGACTSAPPPDGTGPSTSRTATNGGTLRLLDDQQVRTWDPQRLSAGSESAVALRTVLRTLTGYLAPGESASAPAATGTATGTGTAAGTGTDSPAGSASTSTPSSPSPNPASPSAPGPTDTATPTATSGTSPQAGPTPLVGDLATDTGRTTDGGQTWVFTLRQGPAWQDGQPVTCADVKYGIARAFARGRLTGGSPYPATLIDVPVVTDARGAQQPEYQGPYAQIGQAGFDKAVTCDGATLTVRLKAPEADFPAIAALPAFAAYRADHDRGADGILDIFSCGPYQLDGAWETGNGGRLIRNPAWAGASDPLRRARPDVIEIREGLSAASIATRLTEDKSPDDTAVSIADLPTSAASGLGADPAVAARVTTPASGTVELLQPNLKSPVMSNPAVRTAFAQATDRDAFAAAYGGRTMSVAYAVLPLSVPGHSDANPLGRPAAGDPAAAKATLTAAGVSLPVAVKLAYRSSTVADAAYGALTARWAEGGFEVSLVPVAGDYYRAISAPEAAGAYDVFRTAWFPDFPSGGAVIPDLFDGRINLTPTGTGMDVGSFNDPTAAVAIDAASAILDPAQRAAAWGGVDASLAVQGAHIALGERHRLLAHGSGVTAYVDNLWLGGWPDLAVIGVRG